MEKKKCRLALTNFGLMIDLLTKLCYPKLCCADHPAGFEVSRLPRTCVTSLRSKARVQSMFSAACTSRTLSARKLSRPLGFAVVVSIFTRRSSFLHRQLKPVLSSS